MSRVLIQSTALVVDAYRELNSKRLFWITMILSALVVVAFGMFGINEKGLTFFIWDFPLPFFNSTIIAPGVFYKFAFANIGIPIWLSWAATILALISTASIIPDFVASGSIELTLSKPIGRMRLFLSKYFTGLLFVGLQVIVFTGACFLVIGFRGGSWEWSIWLAVPIVMLFFSYLFSVCALVGLITRSTIAALLITLLAWFVCWGVNLTDVIFLQQRESSLIRVEQQTRLVARRETAATKIVEKAKTDGTFELLPKGNEASDDLARVSPMLVLARKELDESKESAEKWERWSLLVYRVKWFIPKTAETIGLLDRYLLSEEDKRLFAGPGGNDEADTSTDFADMNEGPQPEETRRERRERNREMQSDVSARMDTALRSRTTAWVIGTSVGFELIVLGLACLIFVRRDF